MHQTKLESLLEQVVNYTIGFGLAYLTLKWFITPLIVYGYIALDNALIITSIFTVVSVARSYGCRRGFNAGLHKVVQKFVKRVLSK